MDPTKRCKLSCNVQQWMVKRYPSAKHSNSQNVPTFSVSIGNLYSGGNLTCFETLMDVLRPTKLFESFLSGERLGPVHSGVICGREKMIEQNKSPNFPALLQQPIWRSDIVEQSAPDKHAAIETPRRCQVFCDP